MSRSWRLCYSYKVRDSNFEEHYNYLWNAQGLAFLFTTTPEQNKGTLIVVYDFDPSKHTTTAYLTVVNEHVVHYGGKALQCQEVSGHCLFSRP